LKSADVVVPVNTKVKRHWRVVGLDYLPATGVVFVILVRQYLYAIHVNSIVV
jgi:hypothetical protein